jgi:hypothetical protein
MHALFTPVSLAGLAAFFLVSSAPQDPARPGAAGSFVLEAGEHQLLDLIAKAARYLGRNYLLAPTEIGTNDPRVTLQQRLELDAGGCEAVLSQLAYAHGLVATPLDARRGLWELVNVNGSKRAEIMARALLLPAEEVRRLRAVRIAVTTHAPVQHVRATVLAQTLRPFFAASGGPTQLAVGTAGSESTVLLSGMADSVAQALDLIAAADQPAPQMPVDADRFAGLEQRVRALEQAVKRLEGAEKGK